MRAIARFVGLDLRSMRPSAKFMIIPVVTIAGVLLAPVAALVSGAAFDWATAAAIVAGLPAYFGTGPGPVRAVAYLPPAIILAVVYIGWALPGVHTVLLSWLGDANLVWLGLAAITILGVLGAASTRLAARLYARRDL
jgi:hypothetical protein